MTYALNKSGAIKAEVDWVDVIDGQLPAGGTTGQHLVKASTSDYDYEWRTPTTRYTKIAGPVTVDGATNFTISNIPQTYDSLFVELWLHTNAASTWGNTYMRLNGSASAVYDGSYWAGSSTGTMVGGRATAATGLWVHRAHAHSSSWWSGEAAYTQLWIPYYRIAGYPFWHSVTVSNQSSPANEWQWWHWNGIYASVVPANWITSLYFWDQAGATYDHTSRYMIWGMTNESEHCARGEFQ
jgi:hypothetical protein